MLKKTEITQVSVNEVFDQMKTQEYGDVVGIQNIKRKLSHKKLRVAEACYAPFVRVRELNRNVVPRIMSAKPAKF